MRISRKKQPRSLRKKVTPLPDYRNTISEKTALNFSQKKKKGKKKRKYIILSLVLIVLLGLGYFGWMAYSSSSKIFKGSVQGQIVNLLGNQSQTLKGEAQDRTNILIYGMTKDGARTDSVILFSYYWKEKKIVSLNIPRDMYFYDGHENVKLAEVYSYAAQREPKNADYPSEFVAGLVSKEYNIPIHYWIKVNMQGEVDLINTIGGIDVNVPDSFTDYEFPNWNYTGYMWPPPHFNAGLQHMNGNTALIYSRSRHSINNNEGSDFARSKRQALVIQAMMQKMKSIGLIGNIANVTHYLSILGDNIRTSMSLDEMVSFAKTVSGISPNQDYLKANWATGNTFLCDSSNDAGSYIIRYGTATDCLAYAGDNSSSKYRTMAVYFVQNMLTTTPIQNENATLAIYNGTDKAGLATKVSNLLSSEDLNVTYTGNATTQPLTSIIDYSGGKDPQTIKFLESKFKVQATVQTPTIAAGNDTVKVIIGTSYISSN